MKCLVVDDESLARERLVRLLDEATDWELCGEAASGAQALQQIEASPAFVAVIHGLEGDPLIALLLAALLTWACHSSVAVVLLVASLAQAGLVSL